MDKKIVLYDTTLRDGTQCEDINFTVTDKVRIVEKLIDFGIDYIEGGWPGSNPRDIDFFNELKWKKIDSSRLTAFGSTRRASKKANTDEIILALLKAEVPNITIFGKTWDFHITHALGITFEENLELIDDTIRFLKSKVDRVFYDAEHFFDGYISNPEYAIKTLLTARDAGADTIILCETNGGRMPNEIVDIVKAVKAELGDFPIGIHAHNDCDVGVANTILAVLNGASHVQGTINGFGERTGNANLISIIPNLQLKYGYKCIPDEKLKDLRILSRFVNELANVKHNIHQPYVGRAAFAHKGGVHVSAILKDSKMYEHIDPAIVGNTQRVLLSDLSGKSNLIYKAKDFGIDIESDEGTIQNLLIKLKDLENKGFQFEGAEASFEILILKAMNKLPDFFTMKTYRVIDEGGISGQSSGAEATVMLEVNGEIEHTAATGNGPVNALDTAVRKALSKFYPEINSMVLSDYKVRILSSHNGTEATTRVLMLSTDSVTGESWGTVGVADNIIDASYQALLDSIIFRLIKYRK